MKTCFSTCLKRLKYWIIYLLIRLLRFYWKFVFLKHKIFVIHRHFSLKFYADPEYGNPSLQKDLDVALKGVWNVALVDPCTTHTLGNDCWRINQPIHVFFYKNSVFLVQTQYSYGGTLLQPQIFLQYSYILTIFLYT